MSSGSSFFSSGFLISDSVLSFAYFFDRKFMFLLAYSTNKCSCLEILPFNESFARLVSSNSNFSSKTWDFNNSLSFYYFCDCKDSDEFDFIACSSCLSVNSSDF